MTIRINVSVDQEGLLRREGQVRQAQRTSLIRLESQRKLETIAIRERQSRLTTASAGISAETTSIGSGGSASTIPEYTPSFAANRTCTLGDSFGHHQVNTGEAQNGEINSLEFVPLQPLAPPTSEFKLINFSSPPSPLQLKQLRVVWIGVRASCFTYDARSWFGPNPTQTLRALKKFMTCGGIVVFNTEFNVAPNRCAGRIDQFDADINKAFGTSIVQLDGSAESDGGGDPENEYDYSDLVAASTLLDGHQLIDYQPPNANGVKLSDFMPKAIYTIQSGIFSGGTTLYRAPSGESVAAFQKVGKGVLVRFGDSDYYGTNPLARTDERFRARYFDFFSSKLMFFDLPIVTWEYRTRAGLSTSVAEGIMEWQKSKVR